MASDPRSYYDPYMRRPEEVLSGLMEAVRDLRHEIHSLRRETESLHRKFAEFISYTNSVNPDIKHGFFAEQQLKRYTKG